MAKQSEDNYYNDDNDYNRQTVTDRPGRGHRQLDALHRQNEESRPARSTATQTPHSAGHCKHQHTVA